MATLSRGDEEARTLRLNRRNLGDLLAEELRGMDPDPLAAEALGAATGVRIEPNPRPRLLVWRDPARMAAARAAAAQEASAEQGATAS